MKQKSTDNPAFMEEHLEDLMRSLTGDMAYRIEEAGCKVIASGAIGRLILKIKIQPLFCFLLKYYMVFMGIHVLESENTVKVCCTRKPERNVTAISK